MSFPLPALIAFEPTRRFQRHLTAQERFVRYETSMNRVKIGMWVAEKKVISASRKGKVAKWACP